MNAQAGPPAISRKRLSGAAWPGLILVLLFWLGTDPAGAQSLTLDLNPAAGTSSAGRIVQMIALITVLSIAPGLLVVMTSFTRIIIVFSLLRSAMGTQQSPPNTVMVSLALFLTFFIMQPVLEKAYEDGVQPLIDEEISEEEAFERIAQPFHAFMMKHVGKKELELFHAMAKAGPDEVAEDTPLRVLIPAFMISELKRAFEMGFLLFMPFLVVDMVVASILMSMGMMMLPPVMIAMPFKLIFFVLVDGWYMVAGTLVRSFD